MTKDTTKEAAAAAEGLLFDDWFDAIEDGVRARVRGFIETMLKEELCEALSRPRYGRRKAGKDEGVSPLVGVRHGHRTLTGTFGKTRIAVPRARGRFTRCASRSRTRCSGSSNRRWDSVNFRCAASMARAANGASSPWPGTSSGCSPSSPPDEAEVRQLGRPAPKETPISASADSALPRRVRKALNPALLVRRLRTPSLPTSTFAFAIGGTALHRQRLSVRESRQARPI